MAPTKNQTLSWLQGKADEKLILFAIKRARFTWQQRKAYGELRIQIQHYRLIKNKVSKIKFQEVKKVKSILANECKIEKKHLLKSQQIHWNLLK